MAQHIPTKLFKQKAFRTIEHGIEYAFKKSRGLLKCSFRYEFLYHDNGVDIYKTTRKIPKGIVFGSTEGEFEIHYSPDYNIINIYLVA